MGQCLWCCHHDSSHSRVHPVHLTNAGQRQTAADPQTNMPTDLGCESASRLLLWPAYTIAIYCYSVRSEVISLCPLKSVRYNHRLLRAGCMHRTFSFRLII